MTQFGMDRHTGRWNSGWESVAQAIEVLLTTRYLERVLREYVGSPLPALLGETANLETISKFRWAIAITILLFEPRFVPRQIAMTRLDRMGDSSWVIRGIWRPRAHLGDLTEAGEVTLTIGASGAGQIVAGVVMVDLTSLPAPAMIATVDAEAIIARMAASFTAWALDEYGVDVTGIVSLEGEPIAVQMQYYAFQEAQMRAAFNDVLKSNLLAFAAGTDLDHIAADHGVTRLGGETDSALRSRIVLADQGNSAAGPEEWYEFHARSASTEVADVAVYKTGSGPEIEVAVLSTAAGGIPSSELLATVRAVVTSPLVRSINDIVSVVAATKTVVNVVADVWLRKNTPETVFDGLEDILRDALDEDGGIGRDVNESWIKAKLMVAGVSKVAVISPAVDIVMDDHSAATFGTIDLRFKGRKE